MRPSISATYTSTACSAIKCSIHWVRTGCCTSMLTLATISGCFGCCCIISTSIPRARFIWGCCTVCIDRIMRTSSGCCMLWSAFMLWLRPIIKSILIICWWFAVSSPPMFYLICSSSRYPRMWRLPNRHGNWLPSPSHTSLIPKL